MNKLPSYLNPDESLYVLESVAMFMYHTESNGGKKDSFNIYSMEAHDQYDLQNISGEIYKNTGIMNLRKGVSTEGGGYLGDANFCNDILESIPVCDSFLYDEVINRCIIDRHTNQHPLFGLLPRNRLKAELSEIDEEEMFECFLHPNVRVGISNVLNLYHNLKHYELETIARGRYSNIMFFLEKSEQLLLETIGVGNTVAPFPTQLKSQSWRLHNKVILDDANEEILFASILLEMNVYLTELNLRETRKNLRDKHISVMNHSSVSTDPLA